MNNLIILGNGFDLAHGLKTNYRDFVLYYLNSVRHNMSNNPHKIFDDRLLCVKPSHFSMCDKQFESIDEAFKLFAECKYSISYKHDLVKQLFKGFSSGKWVDIEYLYYSQLVVIYRRYENDIFDSNQDAKQSVKDLNKCFKEVIIFLQDYLRTIQINNDIRNDSISRHLKNIVKPEMSADYVNPPVSLILNFNYTKTIAIYDQELGLMENRSKIINIHGEIDSVDNPIIFGYGDEIDPYYPKIENLNINDFLDHIKSFYYFKTGNYREVNSFLDSKWYNVYILGHSCGISDRVLLSSIFNHNNCKEIRIYYYQRKDGSNDYFEKTQEISRHFKSEEKALMRKRIVPFDECSQLS